MSELRQNKLKNYITLNVILEVLELPQTQIIYLESESPGRDPTYLWTPLVRDETLLLLGGKEGSVRCGKAEVR